MAKAERDRKCAEKEAKEKAQRVAKKADAFENNVGRPVQVDKWIDDLASAKTFIDTKGRMPKPAGDADEKILATWIVNNKQKN